MHIRKILSLFRKKPKTEEELSFLENGSALLEELIVNFNGKHNIPIRSFTAKELIRATNSFKEYVLIANRGDMFKGCFEQRPILVKKFRSSWIPARDLAHAIRDLAVTSQMSRHKNVLKLLGCCLEFKIPALVYEYAGNQSLPCLLFNRTVGSDCRKLHVPLSWNRRLGIAKDIAAVVVYLHTAFPTPIIHTDLKLRDVIIDPNGVAKLFDFSLCVSLPPGESQMKATAVILNSGYAAHEYIQEGIITVKNDVFGFGLLLLQLLTGRKLLWEWAKLYEDLTSIDIVKELADKGEFSKIYDPQILKEGGGIEQEQQLQDFLTLTLRCVEYERDDRPEMINVAKELRRLWRIGHR